MQRRSFLGTAGIAGLAGARAAQEPARSRIFVLDYYYLRNGTQKGRLEEFFSKGLLPALAPVHSGPELFLDALVAPHMPQMAVLMGYRSAGEMQEVSRKLGADEAFRKAFEAWEKGDEPPYEHYSRVLLAATDYSPEPEPLNPPPKSPRIFELRVYHSPTERQLRALHERFAGPEIRIFHRVGVHPILYSSTAIGPNMPNLTYIIPFADLAAREKAWAAFGADPEWVKVRRESIERSGQISLTSQISLYRAAAYSPIR